MYITPNRPKFLKTVCHDIKQRDPSTDIVEFTFTKWWICKQNYQLAICSNRDPQRPVPDMKYAIQWNKKNDRNTEYRKHMLLDKNTKNEDSKNIKREGKKTQRVTENKQ